MARRADDGLAYGDIPQRWDRARFERFGGGGTPQRQYEEDYRYTERDRPGRQEVMVEDRIESRDPRGTYEEQDRFVEEERFSPGRRRRRTDKELFGDVDPREFTNLALTPYEPPPPPRPEMLRRRSSFDHYIPRYEVEERRIPVYRPAPVPYEQETYRREVDIEETRGRDYHQPQEYREVEIRREKSVAPPPPKSVVSNAKSFKSSAKSVKSSRAKSVATTRRSSSSSSSESSSMTEQESIHESRRGGRESVHESFHESSRSVGGGHTSVAESVTETRTRGGGESVHESFHESSHSRGGEQSVHESFHESIHESVHGGSASIAESIQETVKKFKKGKTRMPKRLVRREAIQDLGYPYEEEEFFFVLTIALEKEQIDEVMKISETYINSEKKSLTTFKYEESNDVPQIIEPQGERETVTRTEWINPPSVAGGNHRRSRSHAGHRSRRLTISKEESAPIAPIAPLYEGENLTTTRSHGGALVVRERKTHSDREIRDEIARLEAERRAVRLEREAEEKRDWAIRLRDRPREEWELVDYERVRPAREVLELYGEREVVEEKKDVLRVEKDRKERERRRILKLAAATLT